jgi:vitamin B12 transporter
MKNHLQHTFIVLSTLLTNLLSFTVTAQTGSITGLVLDTNQQALPGASVILQKPIDLSSVAGTATDSTGRFLLNVPAGSYHLMVTMSGFQHQLLPVEVIVGKTVRVGPVKLRGAIRELQEAVVTASRRPIAFEAGKTIVTPGASVLTAQGNLFEALKNIPGLVVNEDGTFILNGQKGVNVQVNGKETYLSGLALVSLLKATLATSVDKIELMTNPSAAYDASGSAGIVNIQLRKSAAQGFTFSSHLHYQQGRNGRGDMGLRTTFRNKKTGISLDYSFYDGHKGKKGTVHREYHPANDTGRKTAGQKVAFTNQDQTHNLKLTADWDVSKYITVDAYAGAVFFQRSVPGSSYTSFSSNSRIEDSVLYTSTQSRYQQRMFNGGMRTVYKDQKKNELNFSVDQLSFRHQDFLQMYSWKQRANANLSLDTLFGTFDDKVRMWSAQTNFSKPFPSHLQFQAGLKLVRVHIDNQAIYRQPSLSAITTTSSSQYAYNEFNNAAYLQLSGQFSGWSFQAGLRAENTQVSGTVFDLEGGGHDSTYRIDDTKLFPNLALLYQLTETQDISITYNRRITRPNYRDLSPSGYTMDEYLVICGNTGLQAELTHKIEMAYILKKLYRATVFYTLTDDAIAQGFREMANGGLLVIPENMASRKTLGLKADAGSLLNAKWWQINSSGSLFYTENKWTESSQPRKSKTVTPTLSIHNSFTWAKGWSAQLTGYYNGKMGLGQMETPAVWSVSAGVRKKMWKEQLNLHLYVNDIFASVRERAAFGSGAIDGSSNIRYDETSVGLSIHYYFKKGKQKEMTDRSIEESKRINF